MTELSGTAAAGRTGALDLLETGSLDLTGRLVQASNATFFGKVARGRDVIECVYKPVRGERPLWDFPTGTLAGREVAAYVVSELAGWHLVPPTTLADGPFGPGMLQAWVDVTDDELVDVVPAGAVPDGWLHVLDAYDGEDNPVSLVHVDRPPLRRMALFDVLVNNADRKGGHILPDADGRVLGCDHGVSFHVEYKLRTVLWGWAGDPLHDAELVDLRHLREQLASEVAARRLGELVSTEEYHALLARTDVLLAERAFPLPGDHWPSIPWPAF